jgi:hypothetical protein
MTDSIVSPAYVLLAEEFLLDAPPAIAWPLVIDYPSWQNYAVVRTLDGIPGAVGEVVQMHKDEDGFEFPPYFARTLLIEPEHRIVWKTFVDPDDEEDPLFGIVEFRLSPSGEDQTLFWSSLTYQFKVRHRSAEELQQFEAAQNENFRNLVGSTHPKLRALVAQSRQP